MSPFGHALFQHGRCPGKRKCGQSRRQEDHVKVWRSWPPASQGQRPQKEWLTLDLRLLVSRIVRKFLLRHSICGTLLWQPGKLNSVQPICHLYDDRCREAASGMAITVSLGFRNHEQYKRQ
uniref:Uncharacterized protein n=1 Tax=Rousettus aegyptiacus TaxID=9407 RepID=A0A7J8JGT5_ROUAE|nr:hypothetical protein HJG63_010333 [Rousettus aegyptiacus]